MDEQLKLSPLRDRPKQGAMIFSGLVVSLGLHLFIVVAVFIGTYLGSEALEAKAEEKLAPFTPVELVALGDPDVDDSLLPKIINPPPKEVKEDVVDPNQKPKTDAIKERKERPKDAKPVKDTPKKRDDIFDEFDHNPNLPVTNDKPKGHAEGVPEGTLTDASAIHLMKTWQAKVASRVIGRWRVPLTLGEEKLQTLANKARVYIRISAEGYIVSFTFKGRSGDPQFDNSVERAVKTFMAAYGGTPLPMPNDAALKTFVLKKGFTLSGWGLKARSAIKNKK